VADPWSNQAVSLIVLEEETTGYTGIFGYNPAPGAGNLVLSVTAVPLVGGGTDPYGNQYLTGLCEYSKTPFGTSLLCTQVQSGGVAIYSSLTQAGPWVQQVQYAAALPPPGTQFAADIIAPGGLYVNGTQVTVP
jgi:hypothetical protein